MTTEKKQTGEIVYEGPSRLDGTQIVAILTYESKNTGTGNMAQLTILNQSHDPITTLKMGMDTGICGDCPFSNASHNKAKGGGGCYVNAGQAPLAIYNAWRAGSYQRGNVLTRTRMLKGKGLRLGSYGDPTALPIGLVRQMTRQAAYHTGYTHQWAGGRDRHTGKIKKRIASGWRHLVMASCETVEQVKTASSRGWRSFRVKTLTAPVTSLEVLCAKDATHENPKTCSQCKACDGWKREGQRSIVINGHGGAGVMPVMMRTLAALND
jgi:hypothetical protein